MKKLLATLKNEDWVIVYAGAIILLLAVILYAAVMGIFAAVTAGRRQKRVNDTPYESQFRKE